MARKPAASQRARRLSDLIQRELSMLFFQAHSNVREPGPTITAVEVTRDLSMATVWVTQLNGDAPTIEQNLNQHSPQWRKALAPALSALHKMPQLRFKYDVSLERSMHINTLIAGAMARTEASEAAADASSTAPSAAETPASDD